MSQSKPPQSPEEQPAEVREALDQRLVSHEGDKRQSDQDDSMDAHLGAKEDEPTPVTPPMSGPDHLIEDEVPEDGVDPREELHGG